MLCYSFKIILVGALLIGCSSTKYETVTACSAGLKGGDKILLIWFPNYNTEIFINRLQKRFNNEHIEIFDSQQEEWNLKVAGIHQPLDSLNRVKLLALGYTHLLMLGQMDERSQDFYNYYTETEVRQEQDHHGYKPTLTQHGSQSEVMFQLLGLREYNAFYKLQVKSTINPIGCRGKNGGETQINASSVASARMLAIKKGTKRILKKCAMYR